MSTNDAIGNAWSTISPLACGLRTDHPILGLPIVNDEELGDLTDRHAIEAIGRRPHQEGNLNWGREDRCFRPAGDPSFNWSSEDGWVAFTTSPSKSDFSWLVRELADGTRHVLLYENYAARRVQHIMTHRGEIGFHFPFYGGYFADADLNWYRPAIEYDTGGTEVWNRPVQLPEAQTITANRYAQRLQTREVKQRIAVPNLAALNLIHGGLAVDGPSFDWGLYFDAWQRDRFRRTAAGEELIPLDQSVIAMHDVELATSTLIDSSDMASLAGRSVADFSANRSRGGLAIPQPMAFMARKPIWTHAVGEAWSEYVAAR